MQSKIRFEGISMSKNQEYYVVKRLLDVIGSLVAIILFLPISVYLAFRIKIEDHGPIIYKQERIGRDGRRFFILKFRSMVVGAHAMKNEILKSSDVDGPIFKMREDPRVTKVGNFMRLHSLDEIPQFINVLRGDMSLVGPRPALPEEVNEYTEKEKERLNVLPGLSGLWQVSGRSNLTYEEMIELDLQYSRNQSTWLDLKILAMTVIQMFDSKNSGAY